LGRDAGRGACHAGCHGSRHARVRRPRPRRGRPSRRSRPMTTRVGQVIRVKAESIEEYERIHAEVWPGVLAAIRKANIRDYSIHRYGEYLFATYRHEGDDLAADLAAMAADPTVQEWWT